MGSFRRGISGLVLGILCILPVSFLNAAPEDFPMPESLRPAIDFWVRVYTEVDSNEGFLHDTENLAVVYATVDRSSEEVNELRRFITEDLRTLATGKRHDLSASQRQILSLWPEDVSNQRLARAADNVRFQLGQSDRFLAGVRRSGSYRDHIRNVIQNKSMPQELELLPHVESSFHPGAYSSAAATGMWQFIRSTAQRFMRVDYVVDERLDPYAATYGAMDLLEFNYNALGTWPLALTAYNHGANGMARAVESVGSTDIGRIVAEYRGPRFGFASRNFYAQFRAVMLVDQRLQEFFGDVPLDPHPEFSEVEMPAYVDARVMADALEVDLDLLRRHNPALQPSVWSGTKRIPRGYRLKLDRNDYPGDLLAAIGQVPLPERYIEQIPDLSYTVRRGDSLSVIAGRYDTSISELVAINQLRDRHRIRVGQTLLLPQQEEAPTLVASAEAGQQQIPDSGRYEVRRGDTVSVIAERFSLGQDRLLALNDLSERDVIYPGQTLMLMQPEQPQEDVLLASTDPVSTEAEAAASALDEVPAEQEAEATAFPGAGIALEQLDITAGNTAISVAETVQTLEEEEQLLADLSTDPADYSVARDNTIEIQAAETLGHYAEWLGIRAWDIRRLNGMQYSDPVIIGDRLKLSFGQADRATFERQRREYHRDLQQAFFERWRIRGTEKYVIQRNDLIMTLTDQRAVPLWLFRQYNPDMDTNRVSIGQEIILPVLERVQN